MSKLVFLCHPIGHDPQANIKKLTAIIHHINLTEPEVIPLAPYIGDVLALSDNDEQERTRGLENGLELIRRIWPYIDEARLYGDRISPGMQAEKELFESLGVPVIDMTNSGAIKICSLCNEPYDQDFASDEDFICHECKQLYDYTFDND